MQIAARMDDMDDFVLRIESPGALLEAFGLIMECPAVASCEMHPSMREIRFLAPVAAGRSLLATLRRGGAVQVLARSSALSPCAAVSSGASGARPFGSL